MGEIMSKKTAEEKSKTETKMESEKKNIRMAKNAALDVALASIEKQFGKGSIMKYNPDSKLDVAVIPTGSFALDLALGVGGLPRGRVIEIYGPESSGKTTLAIHTVAEAQKLGGLAAFIDAEHAFDPEYAKRIGVNLDDLLISQPILPFSKTIPF